jgi:hypothetical protein
VSDDYARSRLLAPPRLRTLDDPDEERRATWLERFCALVFVVAVAQLSSALSADRSLEGFLIMCGLFVPVWWAWVGFTFYADRFETPPDGAGRRGSAYRGSPDISRSATDNAVSLTPSPANPKRPQDLTNATSRPISRLTSTTAVTRPKRRVTPAERDHPASGP